MADRSALPLCLAYHPLRLTAHSFSFHRLLGLANDDICHRELGVPLGSFDRKEKRGVEIKSHKINNSV